MDSPGGSLGYGSQIAHLGVADLDTTIVPAGTNCVFDGLLFPGGAGQDNFKNKTTMRTVGFVPLMSFDVNSIGVLSQRRGTNSKELLTGRSGIASSDGLRIIKEAGTLGSIVSVLYRTL